MEPFALDKPTIILHRLRLIEWPPPRTSTAIFPHILTISPLLTVLQNIFYASHNQNISKICNWMTLDHSLFCPPDLQILLRICFHVCICSEATDLCSGVASVVNSIYCNKAAEPYNRPPLESTNKSLFPWLAPAWLRCGVNIEFPNDGPCRL